MVDVRRYKLNPSTLVDWPYGQLSTKALSLYQMQMSDFQGSHGVFDFRVWELCFAIQDPISAQELCSLLTVAELAKLYDSWFDNVQIYAWPPVGRLCDWLKRSSVDCSGVIADGTLASSTESFQEYYGLSGREITPAQLVWYLGLCNAHSEVHENWTDSKGRSRPAKMVTKTWLNKEEPVEMRQRWLMND